ncbi:hypothetical protein DM860_007645 [Cuscuta australis]|uniref:Uncharacterized protein n=1 Tax=Cuscuta australis TaxID=267555 RepID=A0A328E4J4_9ASTE|nr:hypothetical protein DM860_007645 [Cuscuta australis]
MAGNSPEPGIVPEFAGDLKELYAICDAEDEISPEIGEEMVERVMHELLKEITGAGSLPPSPSGGFMVSESCGPAALSGSGSTVMAGIELSFCSGARALSGFPAGQCGGNGSGVEERAAGEMQYTRARGGGEGCDGLVCDDDEWLAVFLSYSPPELDVWF